jgi:hypothetical protein
MVDNIPTSYSGGSYQADDPNETYYFESLQGGGNLYKYVGDDNIKGGTNALADVQGAAFGNIGLGTNALTNLTTGLDNIAIGTDALETLIDGQNNVAIGPRALNVNEHGTNNVCIGPDAGLNITGNNNIVINSANDGVGAGDGNIILGFGANVDNVGRSNCILLGQGATTRNDSGNTQTHNGQFSLGGVTTRVAGQVLVDAGVLEVIINGQRRFIQLGTLNI